MNAVAGTPALIRLALRRDRVMLPTWVAALVLSAAGSASATVGLYPTVASRVEAADAVNRVPAVVALYGRIYDTSSVGALAMVKLGSLGAVFVAVLAILVVVRHTRAEEETGRAELLGAGVVGHQALLAAALSVAFGLCCALGVLTAMGLAAAGLPAEGSLAFGAAWTGVGLAFSAIAAVCAQLSRGARTATGSAIAVLGVVYVLRAIGDTGGPGWLAWLSPIGWGQQFRPFAGNRWWVLLVTLAFAVVAVAAAARLAAARDLGAGLLPARLGPATGRLASPLGLAWRLQRPGLAGWVAGFALGGLVLGLVASSVGDFLTDPQAQEFIARLGGSKRLVDAYLAAVLSILAVVASAYGVMAVSRMRSEESAGHLESVLATATPRWRWAAGHLVVALLGVTLLLLVAGAAAGVSHAAQVGDAGQFWRLLGAALARVPAAWVLPSLLAAGFGVAPRASAVGWAALAGCIALSEIGPLLDLPGWAVKISPFAHAPLLPGAALSVWPLVGLLLVVAVLLSTGVVGLRRRDVPA